MKNVVSSELDLDFINQSNHFAEGSNMFLRKNIEPDDEEDFNNETILNENIYQNNEIENSQDNIIEDENCSIKIENKEIIKIKVKKKKLFAIKRLKKKSFFRIDKIIYGK